MEYGTYAKLIHAWLRNRNLEYGHRRVERLTQRRAYRVSRRATRRLICVSIAACFREISDDYTDRIKRCTFSTDSIRQRHVYRQQHHIHW